MAYCRIVNCELGAHAVVELETPVNDKPLEKVVVGEAEKDEKCLASIRENPIQSDVTIWETGVVACTLDCPFRLRKEG